MSLSAQNVSNSARSFYPALDGLRAVAFLAVFISHYGPVVSTWSVLRAGWVGVDIFFVLSGFLITGILFNDLGTPQYLRRFYLRRALRILPLFYSLWLLLLVLTPFLGIAWTRLQPAHRRLPRQLVLRRRIGASPP